jgi:hemerythrin-like domain-containing protein
MQTGADARACAPSAAIPGARQAMRAIQIIEDEHRSLAAVLHGLLYLVREIRLRGATPDFELLGAMLHYIDAFAQGVADFASFHWEHMRVEESDVLPRARRHLTPADWTEIDAAFGDNEDPLLGEGARASFRELFRRIVNLAPPPLGVGPSR